jgi:hypothetical protein
VDPDLVDPADSRRDHADLERVEGGPYARTPKGRKLTSGAVVAETRGAPESKRTNIPVVARSTSGPRERRIKITVRAG